MGIIIGGLVWCAGLTGVLLWYCLHITPWFFIWFAYGWALFFGVIGMLIICAIGMALLIWLMETFA